MPTILPGRYRHYKGNYYRVLTMAVHSETLEPMVVYQAEAEPKAVWVRPAAMWNELVETPAGTVPRFSPAEASCS